MKVAVLVGGTSPEREASLWTAKFVIPALVRLGHDVRQVDPAEALLLDLDAEVWFNCLHGGSGEDGTIQGALEMHGAKYTGSGVGPSALSMDKLAFKAFAEFLGVPVVPEVEVTGPLSARIQKPRFGGGSMGMRIIGGEFTSEDANLRQCLTEVFIDGVSATVSVLQIADAFHVLPPTAVRLTGGQAYYDYKTKYNENTADLEILDPSVTWVRRIQDYSQRLFHLGLFRNYARFDFVVSADGDPFVLEANSLPGLYPESNFCFSTQAIGMTFDETINQILQNVASAHIPGRFDIW